MNDTGLASRNARKGHPRIGGLLIVIGASFIVAWRLTLGASYEDDGHVVALALRLARGDVPLADEMNFQALGALPAVPFVYAWDHLVGSDGLVLASRVFYVGYTAFCGWISYRGLRCRYARAPALVGVATALLGLPYQLPLVSYSSVPVNALVVATAGGVATLVTRSWRWALVVGVASVGGAIAAPHLAPAFGLLVLLTLVLSRRADTALGIATGVGLPAIAFLSWLATVVGTEGVRRAIDFALGYQSGRLSPIGRLERAAGTYAMLRYPSYGVLLIGVTIVIVASLRGHWWLARRVGAGVALAWAAALPIASVAGLVPPLWFGNTVAALEVILVAVLVVAVVVELRWSGDRDVWRLLVYAALPATAAAALLAATTNSGPQYSVHGTGLAGLFMLLVAEWVVMAQRLRHRVLARLTALIPTAGMALLLAAYPFEEPAAWRLDTRIAEGPWKGLLTTSARANELNALVSTVRDSTSRDRGVMIIGFPGGYLAAQGPMDTHILWLEVSAANQAGLDWIQRTHRIPDVIIARSGLQSHAGMETTGNDGPDPLMIWIAENYRPERLVPGLAMVYVRR